MRGGGVAGGEGGRGRVGRWVNRVRAWDNRVLAGGGGVIGLVTTSQGRFLWGEWGGLVRC